MINYRYEPNITHIILEHIVISTFKIFDYYTVSWTREQKNSALIQLREYKMLYYVHIVREVT